VYITMIEGIGVDIIEIGRIREVITRWGDTFLNRIFTDSELAYCRSRKNFYHHIAARFAAKEAVGKALAIGWSSVFRWRDVEILNEVSGQPKVILHSELKKLLANRHIVLSLSHSSVHVIATAVIERE